MAVKKLEEEYQLQSAGTADPEPEPIAPAGGPRAAFFDAGTPTTYLRGLQMLAFTDNGHVGTSTITDDSGGGAAAAWNYGGTIPCRIDPLGGDERITGARLSERSTHVVIAPAETVVAATNRFRIDNRGTYEVTAVQKRTGEFARFFEVVEVT